MKLHMSRTNGRELRVMNCHLTAVLTTPPVPAARPSVDLLRKLRRPDEHAHGGGWALRHDGWRRTSAVPAEQRRHVLGAAYFTGSIESATATAFRKAATATGYGVDSPGTRSR